MKFRTLQGDERVFCFETYDNALTISEHINFPLLPNVIIDSIGVSGFSQHIHLFSVSTPIIVYENNPGLTWWPVNRKNPEFIIAFYGIWEYALELWMPV